VSPRGHLLLGLTITAIGGLALTAASFYWSRPKEDEVRLVCNDIDAPIQHCTVDEATQRPRCECLSAQEWLDLRHPRGDSDVHR
jgi:hypothetical protein